VMKDHELRDPRIVPLAFLMHRRKPHGSFIQGPYAGTQGNRSIGRAALRLTSRHQAVAVATTNDRHHLRRQDPVAGFPSGSAVTESASRGEAAPARDKPGLTPPTAPRWQRPDSTAFASMAKH
jgi:hypothetical protein